MESLADITNLQSLKQTQGGERCGWAGFIEPCQRQPKSECLSLPWRKAWGSKEQISDSDLDIFLVSVCRAVLSGSAGDSRTPQGPGSSSTMWKTRDIFWFPAASR